MLYITAPWMIISPPLICEKPGSMVLSRTGSLARAVLLTLRNAVQNMEMFSAAFGPGDPQPTRTVRSTSHGRGGLNMPDVFGWPPAANRDGSRSDGQRTADGPRPQHVAGPRWSE